MSNIGVSGIWVCDVGMRFSEDENLVDNFVPIWAFGSTQARHTSRYGICFPGACIVTIMSLDVVCECFLVQLGDEVKTCPHFFPSFLMAVLCTLAYLLSW